MSNKIVLTYIYGDNCQTGKFMKSCANLKLPVHNAFHRQRFMGNGYALIDFYNALNKLKDKYEYVVYSDGGDTFWLSDFRPDENRLVYSTERACYPHPSLAAEYPAPRIQSPWRFLNGGNWSAPINLAIDFFDRYGLNKHPTDISGQHELMLAYLQAIKDGFPMILDEECQYFQTIAFEERGDFRIILGDDGLPYIKNLITNTIPSVIHGNGRTDMDWVYNLRPCD